MAQLPAICRTAASHVGLLLLLLLPRLKEMAQPVRGLFYHLTTKNGLSSNRVTGVIQDRKGYYWIGTQDGLNRFDGSSCRIFRANRNDSTSLSNDDCTGGLLEDDLGNIWIGSHLGVNVYDPRKAKFDRYFLSNSSTTWEKANWIRGIAKDNKGNIYISSYGLWIYNIYTKKWQQYLHDDRDSDSPPRVFMFDPIYDSIKKVLWLKGATGIILFDQQNGKFYYRDHNPQNLRVLRDTVDDTDMAMSSDHKIWNYDPVHHSLIGYSIAENSEQSFARGKLQDVNRLSVDNNDRIWVSHYLSPTMIVSIPDNRIDTSFLNKYHSQSALSNLSNLLFIDRSGNYWLGSQLGISIYDSRSTSICYYLLNPQTKREENPSPEIICFAEGSGRKLWIGTNVGLYHFSPQSMHLIKVRDVFKHDNFIRSLYLQGDSVLWIGGQDDLVRYDVNKERVINQIQIGSAIQSLHEQDHHIWVGTWDKGLLQFSMSGQLERRLEKGSDPRQSIFSNSLLCVSGLPDKSYFWIGYNGGNGYSKVSDHARTFEHFKIGSQGAGNIQNIINCIYEDRNGDLWIGTYGSGLVKFLKQNGSYVNYTQNEGLSGNYINAITEDDSSRIWISTNNGLDILDTRTQTFINTDLDIEQPDNDLHANCLIRKNGSFLFFARNRLVEITPDSFPLLSYPSVLLLNSFRIFDKEILLSDTVNKNPIRLSHDQNFFSFDYSLLKPNPEGHVQYAYMLTGFEPDWNYNNDQGSAKYTNVPPGNYTFRVKARDQSGRWAYFLNPVLINISPPFWKTWWFITAIIALLVLSIYSLFRYRINQVRRLYLLRSNISKDLHDQIGATLTSISFLSEVAKNRENSAELTSSTLDRIGQYSRDMIAEMNDIVWIINPLNDSFEKIVDRVQNFASALTASRNIGFIFEIDPGIKDISLSMRQRKNIYLILKEAINNAAKHSNCSLLKITLHNANAKIYAKIKDNGQGISSSSIKMAGNGLQNMRQRAEEMGGILEIYSEPGHGTTVDLVMPITQNAY